MLIEEARVEVEDAVADDVEPEMPRLDHAGMDRPDHHLVGVVPWIGTVQRPSSGSWSTSGRSGSWPEKRMPCRSCASRSSQSAARIEVDDGGNLTAAYFHCLDLNRSAGCGEQRAHERPIGGRVEPGKAAALRKRVRDTLRYDAPPVTRCPCKGLDESRPREPHRGEREPGEECNGHRRERRHPA